MEQKKIHCNICLGVTNHTVLFSKSQHYEEECPEFGWSTYYERHDHYLVECNGCESISLYIDSDSNAVGGTYSMQYPPMITRKEPKWLVNLLLQDDIDNPFKHGFMREIYAALANSNHRLAVIGIRALLEQVMIENSGDHGSFKKNLNKFQADGYISKIQRESIEPVLEAGHASMHRGFKPSKEDLLHLLDITENILESIYINRSKSRKLVVPQRKA